MDPTALLEEIRSIYNQIFDLRAKATITEEDLEEISELGEELAEKIENLDEWIMKGGFLPRDWEEQRVAVEAWRRKKGIPERNPREKREFFGFPTKHKAILFLNVAILDYGISEAERKGSKVFMDSSSIDNTIELEARGLGGMRNRSYHGK